MSLRDWLSAVATLATLATVRPESDEVSQLSQLSQGVDACDLGSSVATVATVATAVPANDGGATPEQAAELRRLVAIVAANWPADEQAEALAVALADPVDALTSFRAFAAEIADHATSDAQDDPRMRSCRQCVNLSPGGRCLAAWRGESFGEGVAVRRDLIPLDPDRPQRCLPYRPGADDPDQRTGAERWFMGPTGPSIRADGKREPFPG